MDLVVAIAAVALVAWFAGGTIFNVQRGRGAMRWMHDGLPVFGERTTVRWLGSTAVEMTIREGKAPFASLTIVIFLEARDLPWSWALGRARGRRDTLIVRGVLRHTPKEELEALQAASWSGREALGRVPTEWPMRDADGLTVHYASDAAGSRAGALLALARQVRLNIQRLSVRTAEPNFQIHVPLPDHTTSARSFFEAVRTIAERAVG
jgi:hypothetical protein